MCNFRHVPVCKAKIWAKDLEEKYKTEVNLISVSSASEFKEKWDEMGNDKKPIEGVVLIFHGSADDGINGNGEKGVDTFVNPGTYYLLGKNCDAVAQEIVVAGGKGYFRLGAPNLSFEVTRRFHTGQ